MKPRQWLLKKRIDAKLTQEEIASRVNIKRPYYTQIESGTRRPSVKVAKEIAEIIGFDWTLFFKKDCSELEHKEVPYANHNNDFRSTRS
ncbi:helix-turn-helix transcriptional regulator [Peribacillus simplex]|uniref:helix-turn-helix transcriptional regulator n=1 Tax=Peribacillus simplex TaxID=1478 RepID=UPI00298E39F3|nr:helix-turn-helix transcriptional regulator [Peribacillus simplex]MDW7614284.1 helix-turn-helix transcriptional regulator [Peribacillus simplex]QYF82858.1 helix-turn-helix domain-containing protein [Brevibacterium sp. PAMC21349]